MEAELFSVAGGKFHRPAAPIERERAWQPTETLCGQTVVPQNYFATAAGADRHTGGRLFQHLCKRCAARTAQEPRARFVQAALFDLKHDRRPAEERTAAARYENPSLFDAP